jgi:hypothetical protein
MKCSDVQRALPEILEVAPDGTVASQFANEFSQHLQSCPDCADLVSDLKLISSEARQLAESDEPSPRVWLGIAAQLRAEGVIREPQAGREFQPEFDRSAARRPVLVSPSSRRRWSAWWLTPIAAGLVAAGAFVVSSYEARHETDASHTPAVMAQQQPPATQQGVVAPGSVVPQPVTPQTVTNKKSEAAVSSVSVQTAGAQHPPQSQQESPASTQDLEATVEPLPSAEDPQQQEDRQEDRQFLRVVSTHAPAMRTAYESQLQAVNADIRETQAYVKQNPGDLDARQHLMDAYQQKALLYEMALDRIQ